MFFNMLFRISMSSPFVYLVGQAEEVPNVGIRRAGINRPTFSPEPSFRRFKFI
jgi:hypothetical protein